MIDFQSITAQSVRVYCELETAFNRLILLSGFHRRYYSQKGQDRWLIEDVFPEKRGGYFLEIGGGNGITHSNTYILEKRYNWSGIIIEANPLQCKKISKIRKASVINVCADSMERSVSFLNNGDLGGIVDVDTDNVPEKRVALMRWRYKNIVQIPALSVNKILSQINAPTEIHYMSLDIEGAELRVLQGIDFNKYRIYSITVERPTKSVHDLLVKNGYLIIKQKMFDGFYLLHDYAKSQGINGCIYKEVGKKIF